MVGVPADHPEAAVAVVRSSQPGGVFLRGRSRASISRVAAQVRVLQGVARGSDAVSLHVAVDQEGGQVRTLLGSGFGSMPTALVQGRWEGATLEARATAWARSLHRAGVTLNLAPVGDTVTAADSDDNPPIGAHDRQYGSDPAKVADAVVAVVRGMQRGGVRVTLKHFPGLGRVRANTDTSAAAVDEAMTAGDPVLRPFSAGIAAGADAVMMSSARYPQLDAKNLAVFSPSTISLLSARLGFGGLVVSDDLGAAVAVRSVLVGHRAVAFIAAGGHLLLTVRSGDAAIMRRALLAEVARSLPFSRTLDRAVLQVLMSKYRAGLLTC
jgi:beta-N-acetylhexosaminidase